ncbi:uncharacterized protein LOC132732046 [Ruditapes philippinarum]|uniref:uncharacterized protein LOC132732046 n=1 Tax=Ruditapes philippinarum TaxID=129788 RepID=UPI00295AE187|nr:uncharacterized protein LOC132732046 [Ruditapes philippinarum]
MCEKDTGNCVCNENHVGNNCSLCKPFKYGQHCHLDCPKECLTCTSDEGCHQVDVMSSTLHQRLGSVLFIVSLVCLIIVIMITVISTVQSFKNEPSRRAVEGLGESVTYTGVRNSEEILSCKDDKRNQQHVERVENINPAVIVGSVEPTEQENINIFYVNVNEYASIERKQFQNITEDNEDEIQPADDNELVDAFLYANTEEFFKRRVPVDKLRDFVKNKTDLEYIEEFMVTFKDIYYFLE